MKTLTLTDVLDELEREIVHQGSVEAVAKEAGVTAGYVSHIRSGRRAPGDALLKSLGFRRVDAFERYREKRS